MRKYKTTKEKRKRKAEDSEVYTKIEEDLGQIPKPRLVKNI